MSNDNLGDRMKGYEGVTRTHLISRLPVIIRLDGKAFHTFTHGMARPWDERFASTMWATAAYLCEQVQGCRMAYVQSDEISLLLTDWEKHTTQPWFEYGLQKVCSVSAGLASSWFATSWALNVCGGLVAPRHIPCFDSRAFNLPLHEVVNYFVWRQQDATRNSIQALGQHHIGRKRVVGMDTKRIQDRLMLDYGVNWNDCLPWQKRGACLVREVYDQPIPEQHRKPGGPETCTRSRWVVDMDTPIFTRDRDYIERHLVAAPEAP